MTQVALPDHDHSIALAQTAREDLERELLVLHPMGNQLIERAKKKRAEFIAALLRRFAARLKSPDGAPRRTSSRGALSLRSKVLNV